MSYFKIALDPYGQVYSCCLASQPNETNGYLFSNIKNEKLSDIWEKEKDYFRNPIKRFCF
jgi:radical SAM protein with 4Fe4S-binding SPASM domain